jgi:WD40 repeat protein
LQLGIDGSVKSWDIAKNYELGLYYKEESDPVNAITHNPVLDLFATTHTLSIRIWRINKEIFVKNECEYSILQPTDILILNISNENSIVVVGSEKGSLFFIELQHKSLKLRKEEQEIHKKGVWKLIDMKKYDIFFSCSKEENLIIFWNSKDLSKIKEFRLENEYLYRGICWNGPKNEIYCSFGNNELNFLKVFCIDNEIDVHLDGKMKNEENLQIFALGANENIILSACKNQKKKEGSSHLRFFLF